MKIYFNHLILEELYELPIKETGKLGYPQEVVKHFKKKIDILKNAPDLKTIWQIKGLNLEKLKAKVHMGSYSIRVNDKYRIIFSQMSLDEVSVLILELSNHYD